ncbi:preprotein translocase subunit SecY [Sulfolobales archaeon HS-7]|nr:preprotein translocase subunit SecY [Sulfolobales archaeon HS-7]
MASFVDILSELGTYLPAVTKPKQKPTLGNKLLWTAIALAIYLVMASVPLYGVTSSSLFSQFLAEEIIFASTAGTLAQLGIGPIITAGLIMQILVGSKLLDMDLNSDEDKAKFTTSQKGLAFIFILVESFLFGYVLTRNSSLTIGLIVAGQLIVATFLILLLDELIQKGWGLGSGVSLFILAGVVKLIFWDMFGITAQASQDLPIGFFPTLVSTLASGKGILNVFVDFTKPFQPDLVGLVSTIGLIVLLVYLTAMKIEIPVTTQRLRGIRTTIPLSFLYVSSIPVIFVSVLASDIGLFGSIASYFNPSISSVFTTIENIFIYPPNNIPHSVYALVLDPLGALEYGAVFILLSLVFGILWVDVAGLDPSTQARNLIDSGVEIPGMRANPKVLENILGKYIYPLAFFSSLIVAVIAIFATYLGAYGTGVGILLAVTIAQQYYSILAYERSLEMYPLLKRLIGEE